MSEDDRRYQTDLFKKELFECIDKFAEQYQITYAEAIGVLECIKLRLAAENGVIPDFEL